MALNILKFHLFKSKKIKLEISNNPYKKKEKKINEENKINKNICKCNSNAVYICEKCEEFLCEFCQKQKKHITHNNNVIKISEYINYVKDIVKDIALELDEKIINDEAYKFLKYWNYDKEKEIKNIDLKYEYLKKKKKNRKRKKVLKQISLF